MTMPRLTKALGVCAAAAACVALASSPASAGTNTAHSRGEAHHGCSYTSEGWFVADGDKLYIKDTCAEGWSAVLKVDVAPLTSDDWGYDHLVVNDGGSGTTKLENGFNFPEGKKICVSAGTTKGDWPQPGEMGAFGPWKCGTT